MSEEQARAEQKAVKRSNSRLFHVGGSKVDNDDDDVVLPEDLSEYSEDNLDLELKKELAMPKQALYEQSSRYTMRS